MKKHSKYEHLSDKELGQRIQKFKAKMITYGFRYGLSHPHTIEISQKLDDCLNEFQKR